jgi:PAS domain S-box-containing protein
MQSTAKSTEVSPDVCTKEESSSRHAPNGCTCPGNDLAGANAPASQEPLMTELLPSEPLHSNSGLAQCQEIESTLSMAIVKHPDDAVIAKVLDGTGIIWNAGAERGLSAAIVEHSNDAIISKTIDGTVMTWNSGAERMFGYTAAEMTGRPITHLFPPDLLHEEAELIAQLQLGKEVSHFETRRLRKNGASIDVSVTLSPVLDAGGKIIAISKIARDITEKQQHQLAQDAVARELRDKNQQLERSNRDLEDFAYVASHDLKTPLGGIKCTALCLEEDLHDSLSDESHKLFGLMRSRINRMETLLDDLLAYSRLGRNDTAVSETRLADIFASIIELLDPPAHIRVRVEGELPVIVTASAQLEQVLRNLINNAIKHHDKQKGEVVLSAERLGDFVEFVVRDDGPGIPPQFHEKIFQLFQTLKRRDEVEGSGMGLAIVKKLVERQNCRVTVHSQGNGAGTQFRFQWPILQSTVDDKTDD